MKDTDCYKIKECLVAWGLCPPQYVPHRGGTLLVPTLCVLKKIIGIGRRASGGWGYNAEHCNQIVYNAECGIKGLRDSGIKEFRD